MISLIVAMDLKRTIGVDNQLPWHLPADLQYFKKVTSGHTIVMGRRTYESIGKPLPNRKNLILSTQSDFFAPGCEVYPSIPELMKTVDPDEELFVIGGAGIFQAFLPIADRLYITLIDHVFAGDTFFPEIEEATWQLVSSEQGIKDEKNPYDYRYTVWERR